MSLLTSLDWVVIGLYFLLIFVGALYATWRERRGGRARLALPAAALIRSLRLPPSR